MDDKTFELVSKINLEELKTAYKVSTFRVQKGQLVTGIVFGIAFAVFGLWYLLPNAYYQNQSPASHGWEYARPLLAIMVSAVLFSAPFRSVNNAAKKAYQNHIDSRLPLQTTRIITGKGVESVSEQSCSFVEWSQITHAYTIKNSIVLFYGNYFITLGLDDLVKGSPEDLLSFVRSKVPLKAY